VDKPWWWDHKFEDKDVEEERLNRLILQENTKKGKTL
jgi:hypothetical protein